MPAVLHARGDAALDEHALGECVGRDGEIGPAARGLEVSARSAPAPAVSHRGLEIAGALLGCAVEIVVAGNADLLGSLDESLADLMGLDLIRDRERSVTAVK